MSDVAPDDFSQQDPEVRTGTAHTLGAQLAAEREAREWTVEYVAGQLNLAVRQIQALEADNYAALPGLASVRGFVRAYAKLLRIDADSLVGLIVNEQVVPNQPLEPKPHLSSTPFSHSRLNGGAARGNSFKGAILALIVVLIAAAAIGIEHLGGWPTLSQSLSAQFKDISGGAGSASASSDEAKPAADGAGNGSAEASTPSAPSTAPAAVDPAQSQPLAQPQPAQDNAPAPVASVPAPVAQTPASPASVPAQAAPASAPASASASVPTAKPDAAKAGNSAPASTIATPGAAGAGKLVLTARQKSWVDVRAGSNVVVSHLIKAGDTETIDVPGAATLTIGNASGVDATFRGQSVSTKTDGKTNVAHISLK